MLVQRLSQNANMCTHAHQRGAIETTGIAPFVCIKDPNFTMPHLLEHINQDKKGDKSKDKDSTVHRDE